MADDANGQWLVGRLCVCGGGLMAKVCTIRRRGGWWWGGRKWEVEFEGGEKG